MDLASTMKQRDGKLELQVRTGWLRGMLVMGFGAGGGIAAGWGLLELVSHDPKEGFAVLKAWGPWALVVALAMLLAWKIATQAIALVKVGVEAFMRTSERGAVASESQAAAGFSSGQVWVGTGRAALARFAAMASRARARSASLPTMVSSFGS